MAGNRSQEIHSPVSRTLDRKAWSRPVCRRLRAGLAENIPGAHIFDGPLETIGS